MTLKLDGYFLVNLGLILCLIPSKNCVIGQCIEQTVYGFDVSTNCCKSSSVFFSKFGFKKKIPQIYANLMIPASQSFYPWIYLKLYIYGSWTVRVGPCA